ncbi:MAG TPA: NAD(P)H-binding protein [Nitrososphaeraceae archaeon]|nr:NAD(P)H-binding protein [Nitrososphaeraceae archaeon]
MKLLINEMETRALDKNNLKTNSRNTGTNNNIDANRQKKIRILVSGASGFIGQRLVKRLLISPRTTNWSIRCMTRKPNSFSRYFQNGIDNLELVQADAQNYSELVKALTDVDVAFYLIHSMEGSSKEWKKFAERDRVAAENFARAVNEAGVMRVIYLGGLTYAPQQELSKHMRSRMEVGEILKKSNAAVTIFRAAVILGQGGGSFQMLQYLVERLPLMVCPKWVLTRCQPIAVDDVVEYLVRSIGMNETISKTFDIGGPEILTYLDMMRRYGSTLKKSIKIIIIPFLTPRLSSYWIDLITPVKASLARPLIDSLKHEAIVRDKSILDIIPLRLKNFENSIQLARNEQTENNKSVKKEGTSSSLNKRILLVSTIALAIMGFTYYLMDAREEILQPKWLVLAVLWYFGIALSIFFIHKGARLGSIIAGIIGWITLMFWLLDNFYLIFGTSILASPPEYLMTIRNCMGATIAAIVIASSHNLFHKIRIHCL